MRIASLFSHAAQQAQLVRDGGLADADEGGDVAHAQLAARQRVEDPDARRVAEDAERVSQRFDGAGRQQRVAPSLGVAGIEVGRLAGVGRDGANGGGGIVRHMNI